MKNEITENKIQTSEWDRILDSRRPLFDLQLREVWRYKFLIFLFVQRNFVTRFKQTILGHTWYFITPIINTVVLTVIFSRIAKLSTDGVPDFLFYQSGTLIWGFFGGAFGGNSSIFTGNAGVFGKVYFPRLVIPISSIISNLFDFTLQLIIFAGFYIYYINNGAVVRPNLWALLLPFMLLYAGMLGLGPGIIVSSLTTKYRDLIHVMGFGMGLVFYATPVVYPLSIVPEEYRMYYMLNPVAAVVEVFRHAFVGVSSVTPGEIALSLGMTVVLFIIGGLLFTRTERNFMDTV